jgi:drug/metabolite transporter (DMT)-like permease
MCTVTLTAAAPPTKSGTLWTALAIIYLVWGSTYLGMAVVVESMPPLIALGMRFLTATVLMGLILTVRHGPSSLVVPWREVRNAMFVGSLLLGVGIGAATLGIRYVPSGVAALIIAVVPLWAVVLRAITGDRSSGITVLGVLAGLVGLGVLVWAGAATASHAGSNSSASSGQLTMWSLIIAGGSASWALGSFLQPRLATPSNPSVLTFYEMLAGGLALTTVGLLRGEHLGAMGQASTRSWIAWVYLVLIGSLVAYSAYVWLLGNAPLSLVTTYAYVNPVVAVLLGWGVKSEPITLGIVLGGAIILSGVVLVVSGERSSE